MLRRQRHLMAHRNVPLTSCRTVILSLCGFTAGILLVTIIQMVIGTRRISCGLYRYRETDQTTTILPGGLPSSTEEKFLFVGIITTRKYLATRAVASSMTWASRVPGKVVYFLEKGDVYEGDLNVVQLDGITENVYPPQKKSFAMLQYINQHYAAEYQWILRADDDLYIKVEELVKFLKSIDHRKLLYIGQPGQGKPSERGKLGLTGAYCMGGPGVIMSNALVKALSPHLVECLNTTITDHEDTELGRCINTHLKLLCCKSNDMGYKFYQNYANSWHSFSSFDGYLGKQAERALTLHPFKESAQVFRVDNLFTNRTVQKVQAKEAMLIAEMAFMDLLTNKTVGILPDTRRIFNPRQWARTAELSLMFNNSQANNSTFFQKGENVYDLHKIWNVVKHATLFSVFLDGQKLSIPGSVKGLLNLQLNTIKDLEASSWFIEAKSTGGFGGMLGITYQHLSTAQGTEEIVFIRNVSTKNTTIAPVFIRRNFLEHHVDFRESQEEHRTENYNNTMYVLLTVFGKSAIYRNYLQKHKKAVDGYRGKVVLRVVLFEDDAGEHTNVSAVTTAMLKDNSGLHIQISSTNNSFGRANGLKLAMEDLDNSSLLLLMDVDMEYTSDFLYRAYRNAAMGRSAYFPVVFSHFSPDSACYKRDNCEQFMQSLHPDVGFWRSYGFGVVSVVKQDFIRSGGFKTDIKGWGLEDVDLYEKLITTVGTVIRAADDGIIHRYHKRVCSPLLSPSQLTACSNSRWDMYGSKRQLDRMYADLVAANHTAERHIR
ncbi:hypothetical protein BsWGS_03338 [Bradybaena similaris]